MHGNQIFVWKRKLISEIQRHFPNSSLRGGGCLCDGGKYANSATRADWQLDWEELGVAAIPDYVGTELEHVRTPLIVLDCRHMLSLGIEASGSGGCVYYVHHSGQKPDVISPDFDSFLTAWESVCYIHPTFKNLATWVDSQTAMYTPDVHRASDLRRIMERPREA